MNPMMAKRRVLRPSKHSLAMAWAMPSPRMKPTADVMHFVSNGCT